jgi:hypothetical protein
LIKSLYQKWLAFPDFSKLDRQVRQTLELFAYLCQVYFRQLTELVLVEQLFWPEVSLTLETVVTDPVESFQSVFTALDVTKFNIDVAKPCRQIVVSPIVKFVDRVNLFLDFSLSTFTCLDVPRISRSLFIFKKLLSHNSFLIFDCVLLRSIDKDWTGNLD